MKNIVLVFFILLSPVACSAQEFGGSSNMVIGYLPPMTQEEINDQN